MREIIKVGVEISEPESKRKKTREAKSWLFEKINIIDKSRKKTEIKIRNEEV